MKTREVATFFCVVIDCFIFAGSSFADEPAVARWDEIRTHYARLAEDYQQGAVQLAADVEVYQSIRGLESPGGIHANNGILKAGDYGHGVFPTLLVFDETKRSVVRFSVLNLSRNIYEPSYVFFDGDRTYLVDEQTSSCFIRCRLDEMDVLPPGDHAFLPLIGRSPKSTLAGLSTSELLSQMQGNSSLVITSAAGSMLEVSTHDVSSGVDRTHTLTFSLHGVPQLLSDRLSSLGPTGGRVISTLFVYDSKDDLLPRKLTAERIGISEREDGTSLRKLSSRVILSDIEFELVVDIDDDAFRPDLSSFDSIVDECGGETTVTPEKSRVWLWVVVGVIGLSAAWYKTFRQSDKG